MPRDWFWLYRPAAPSHRAQSIQVVHTAAALAARGHRVELCVQGALDPASTLAYYGIAPVPTLTLRVLSPRNALASWAYRGWFARWCRRVEGLGVAYARNKRHAAWATRWFPRRFRLLLEAHEVDSVQAADRGEDPEPMRRLERTVLNRSWGLVANCEGTLATWQRHHRALPPAVVVHNAARPAQPAVGPGKGIGVVGSIRPTKDPETVARAAGRLGSPVVWIGPPREKVDALQALAGGQLRWEPPLAPALVPSRLAGFHTLLLPLSPGRFGDALTSPLKLWDALQSGVPLVAADTAAVRAAAADAFHPYTPGDAESLARALSDVQHRSSLRRRLVAAARQRARTWDQRAAEIEGFGNRVLA